MKKYHLYVYKHNIRVPDLNSDTPYFDMSIPYLIGVDCATGKDGDNTAICITHPYTLEVVGELLSPVMGGLDLMRVITMLAKMIPRALFCLESNLTGVDIIDFVQESQLENRFYHDPRATELTKNITEPQNVQITLKQRAQAKKHFGTYVSTKTRKMMFNLLRNTLHDYRHLIYTKFLVKDICNLVEHKNGKIAAADGEHDDLVMAYLHTLYVLTYGYELGRFGIYKSLCTYEKSTQVMKEYEQSIEQDKVNNDLPSDNSLPYEAQLLHDLTSQLKNEYNNPGGYDEYVYKREQYNQNGLNQTPVVRSTAADLAFFREVNDFNF